MPNVGAPVVQEEEEDDMAFVFRSPPSSLPTLTNTTHSSPPLRTSRLLLSARQESICELERLIFGFVLNVYRACRVLGKSRPGCRSQLAGLGRCSLGGRGKLAALSVEQDV